MSDPPTPASPVVRRAGVTVVMPVYEGDAGQLQEAIDSVVAERLPLLVLDNASSRPEIRAVLEEAERAGGQVEVVRRTRNLGLFGSLNEGVPRVATRHALLLCADDRMLPGAAGRLQTLLDRWGDADVVLGPHETMDPAGARTGGLQAANLRLLVPRAGLLGSRALPLLARFGSINGNLSGILLRVDAFERLPKFRADWTHAADWAWLADVARHGSIAVDFELLVEVRAHAATLSASNYRSGSSLLETAALLGEFRDDPRLRGTPGVERSLDDIGGSVLWHALKHGLVGHPAIAGRTLRALARSYGLRGPVHSLLVNIPERARRRLRRPETGAAS